MKRSLSLSFLPLTHSRHFSTILKRRKNTSCPLLLNSTRIETKLNSNGTSSHFGCKFAFFTPSSKNNVRRQFFFPSRVCYKNVAHIYCPRAQVNVSARWDLNVFQEVWTKISTNKIIFDNIMFRGKFMTSIFWQCLK